MLSFEGRASSGSLYSHIDSKQELLFDIIERAIRAKKERIQKEIQKCEQGTPDLECYVRGVLYNLVENRKSLSLAIREHASLSI